MKMRLNKSFVSYNYLRNWTINKLINLKIWSISQIIFNNIMEILPGK
jgi:intergrase/recombinase